MIYTPRRPHAEFDTIETRIRFALEDAEIAEINGRQSIGAISEAYRAQAAAARAYAAAVKAKGRS